MRNFLSLIALTILIFSCRKDPNETKWKTQVLTPLVKTELSIEDILKSKALNKQNDNSYEIVINDTLIEINTDSLVSLPDTVLKYGVSLKTLTIPNDTLSDTITFGDIFRAQGMNQATIDFIHNSSIPINAIGPLTSQDIEISNKELFESIKVQTGKVEIIIQNNLPIDIENVDFVLNNTPANGGNMVLQETFASIPSKTSASKEQPLDGKTVYSDLIAKLNSISSPGSGGSPILIDTNDAIIAKVVVKDVIPIEATAIWPDQNLVDTIQMTSIPPENDVMLKMIKVKTGNVAVKVYSSLEDTIYLDFTVPNLIKGGQYFKINTKIPPAPSNGFADITLNFPFDGYDFIFTGYGIEATTGEDYNGNAVNDPDTINTYIQTLKARMPYTGKMVHLSQKDTIFLEAGIKNVVPEYAEGYFGKNKITVGPDSINLDIFNNYVSGSLDLEKVNMNLSIKNDFGVAFQGDINTLKSVNTKSNNSLNLTHPEINSPIVVNAATDGGSGYNPPVTSFNKQIKLTEQNSNVDKFIEVLPNKFEYNIDLEVNHNIPAKPTYTSVLASPPNFLYAGSKFQGVLNLQMPLSFISDTLLLVDTLDFNIGNINSSIDGKITMVVDNGYPFDAISSVYFLDQNNNKIDSLWINKGITRGTIDPVTKKVTKSTRSKIDFNISAERLTTLKNAKKAIIQFGFHTFDMNDASKEYYKIYSDYLMAVKLIGDFEYEVKR